MARHCWRCDDCVRPDPCGSRVDESGHCDFHRTAEEWKRELDERRNAATERLANALRNVLPAAEKWAVLEACRLSGKPQPTVEDARAVPEWAACLEAEKVLEATKGGAA